MSKLSSLMEAAKQNKKKTAIIAVVVVLVLAALFMRFKGGSKGGSVAVRRYITTIQPAGTRWESWQGS